MRSSMRLAAVLGMLLLAAGPGGATAATAKSLILTMIDIDVRPSLWSHWIVVYLPPDSTGIARGQKTLPGGARGVVSNFGDAFYDGPCPPEGTGLHHYRF